MHKYLKKIGTTAYISEWKSKGLCDEVMESLITSDNSLTPGLIIGKLLY